MQVLLEYGGYALIERYGRRYVRFYGGRDEDIPCEIPVSLEIAGQILEEPVRIFFGVIPLALAMGI